MAWRNASYSVHSFIGMGMSMGMDMAAGPGHGGACDRCSSVSTGYWLGEWVVVEAAGLDGVRRVEWRWCN